MDEVAACLDQWAPSFSEEERQIFLANVRKKENNWERFLISWMDLYIYCISPYIDALGFRSEKLRDEESPASGFFFFTWSFALVIHFPNWSKILGSLLNYNLLYLFVDHYIDDPSIDKEIKKKAVAQMFLLLENPGLRKELTLVDPVLGTVAELYEKILLKTPSALPHVKRIFFTQIEGLRHQNNKASSEDDLYAICEKKGGFTMQVIASFFGNDDERLLKKAYDIGAIMQFIDDCIDLEKDLQENISTIATFVFFRDGTLDSLIVEICQRIRALGDEYWLFKIIYSIFVAYIPDRWEKYFSPELRRITHSHNFFDHKDGWDGAKSLVRMILTRIRELKL